MSRKQLFVLFGLSLVINTGGPLAFGLFPVYAARLGADAASIGNYFASFFVALVVGNVLGGWLSDRFQHRKVQIIAAGLVAAGVFFLASQVGSLWQLIVLLDIESLFAGIVIATVSILA